MLSASISRLLVGGGVLLLAAGAVVAQTATRTLAKAQTLAVPTFSSLAQASVNQDYTATQLRRFRDESGNIVTVREQLAVDANGTLCPPYTLSFVAVEGEPAGSPLSLEWQTAYQRYAPTFFQHSLFRVREKALAESNYTLHDFGAVTRAGRSARRMVVFPNTGGKAIWILDVDTQTSVPLYSAEFDNSLQMLSEVEMIAFAPTASLAAPMTSTLSVTLVSDFSAAVALMGNPSGLVEPNLPTVPDFSVDRYEVQADALNGQQKLVINYSDGIDQFVIVQAPGALDPFDGLPSQTAGFTRTIARFRDPALSALVFWEGDVSFYLAGRGAMQRLDGVAKRLYLQAMSN